MQEQLQSLEPIDLIIYVESARGLLDLKDICEHFLEMAEFTKCRLAGIVFGSDDFCANIGESAWLALECALSKPKRF